MALTDKPKRSTVYLDPELHKALKLQAAETSNSSGASPKLEIVSV